MATRISKKIFLQRWDVVPQEIKDAMSSGENSDALDLIYANLHIPADRQKYVALIASYVFMGFVSEADVAKELEATIPMNSLHARELADALSTKIFAPYRTQIEKIYTGIVAEPAPQTKPTSSELSLPKTPQPIPFSLTKGEETKEKAATIKTTDVVAPSPKQAAPATKINIPPPASMPTGVIPASLPAQPIAPKPLETKSVSAPTPAPASQKPAPAPFMIHNEGVPAPVVQAPKFRLDTMGGSMFAGEKAPSSAPAPKPAQIEIGREEKLKPAITSGKTEAKERIIHYSPLSSPISSAGGPTNSAVAAPSFGSMSPMPAKTVSIPSPAAPATPAPTTQPTSQPKEPLFPSKPITPFTSPTKADAASAFNPPIPTASPAARPPVSIPINKPMAPPTTPKPLANTAPVAPKPPMAPTPPPPPVKI